MSIGTTTALVIALAATAIGTGVSAYSQYQAGKAQQALNNRNAEISDQAALDAERDSRFAANEQRKKGEALKARQRALYAKAGVVAATGSPLLVQVEQAGELELTALDIERGGSITAAQQRNQAVLDRMAGRSARTTANLNTAGTILQGIGSSAGTYANYRSVK